MSKNKNKKKAKKKKTEERVAFWAEKNIAIYGSQSTHDLGVTCHNSVSYCPTNVIIINSIQNTHDLGVTWFSCLFVFMYVIYIFSIVLVVSVGCIIYSVIKEYIYLTFAPKIK